MLLRKMDMTLKGNSDKSGSTFTEVDSVKTTLSSSAVCTPKSESGLKDTERHIFFIKEMAY